MTKPRAFIERFNREYPAGPSPRREDERELHGEFIPAPYEKTLGKSNHPYTREWIRNQNARFDAFMEGVDVRDAVAKRVHDHNARATESIPKRYGDVWISGYSAEGLDQKTVLLVRDRENGEPRILIDPAQESSNPTARIAYQYPSPNGKYVAYGISENDSDYVTLRIRDVATGKDLRDEIPNYQNFRPWKSDRPFPLNWDADSKGFRYTLPDSRRKHAMGRAILHHKVGRSNRWDRTFLAMVEDGYMNVPQVNDQDGNPSGHEFIELHSNSTHRHNGLYYETSGKRRGGFDEIFSDNQSYFYPVAVVHGKLYAHTNHEAPLGKLVAVDLAQKAPEHWETIIPEHEQDTLRDVRVVDGMLIAHSLHDVASKVSVYTLDGTHKHDAPLPEMVSASVSTASKPMVINVDSWVSEDARYHYDPKTNKLSQIREADEALSVKDTIVERIMATAKDGTKIPMTVIRDKNTKLDGTAATMLHGYGAFGTVTTPCPNMRIENWVKQGGIYVEANVRGGGEFGSEWHEQGRLLNKQNSFDDFAACAEHLIAEGYTKPERLVSIGTSAGGYLVLSTALQNPELFGAVIAEVPANAHAQEFGDEQESPEMLENIKKIAPVHNIKKDGKYPPIFVHAADNDERVRCDPYEIVATLHHEAPDSFCLLKVEQGLGHSLGKRDSENYIQVIAYDQAFIERAIGPISQEHYHASEAARPTREVHGAWTAREQAREQLPAAAQGRG